MPYLHGRFIESHEIHEIERERRKEVPALTFIPLPETFDINFSLCAESNAKSIDCQVVANEWIANEMTDFYSQEVKASTTFKGSLRTSVVEHIPGG